MIIDLAGSLGVVFSVMGFSVVVAPFVIIAWRLGAAIGEGKRS